MQNAFAQAVACAAETLSVLASSSLMISQSYATGQSIVSSPSKELYFKYDLTQLADFDIWYCEYANVPTFYYQFSMWQYSSSGKVDGIEGDVDMNICFTNIADYD